MRLLGLGRISLPLDSSTALRRFHSTGSVDPHVARCYMMMNRAGDDEIANQRLLPDPITLEARHNRQRNGGAEVNEHQRPVVSKLNGKKHIRTHE